MDFTLDMFGVLLRTLSDSGFTFTRVKDYSGDSGIAGSHKVILRHDVDRRPSYALACARIEASLGFFGTYYFRITPGSFNKDIIQEIAAAGHEIGYHYEDLDLVARRGGTKGEGRSPDQEVLAREAFGSFGENLEKFRQAVTVTTACMHGSPMSPYDSRLIWKYFDYCAVGIETEPYFDISLERMLYLTDTGRRWDGSAVSIRDKVYSRNEEYYRDWVRKPLRGSAMAMTAPGDQIQREYRFRHTGDILAATREGRLPERIFLTVHPQRWSNVIFPWMGELVIQNLKNSAKYFINKRHIG
ncbi:MAG: hypothetical protein AB9888_03770 [Bacteroidales bacterium]